MASCSVGISVGSEFCVVAVTNTTGVPQVYANADGDRTTPTYSAFVDGEILHGNSARTAFVRQPAQTIPYLLPLLSPIVVNEGRFQPKCDVEVVTDEASGDERVVLPTVDCDGVLPTVLPRKPEDDDDKTNPHTTTEVMHSFLADLKAKTIDGPCSGRPVASLCVTVPRYMELNVVRAAFEGAGLAKEVRVIYDDVATVLAQPIGNVGGAGTGADALMLRDRTDILVIDWGANVLSVSILRLEGGIFRLIGHSHRFNAGGIFLDKYLAKQCAEAFFRKTRISASENSRSMRKIALIVEAARKTLTMSTATPLHVEAFCDGVDHRDTMSRVKLDMAIRDSGLIDKLEAVLKEAVEMADPADVINCKHVILAGGLCRTQFIQMSAKAAAAAAVPGAGSATVHDSVPADEAAALGACAEAYFATASLAALTLPFADVAVADKLRPINAAIKSLDSIDSDVLEAPVALYVGAEPFAKAAALVDAADAAPPCSPNNAVHQEFGKFASERGVYKLPTASLHLLAARGAPMPVSSPLIEAGAGAAIVPVAIVSVSDSDSFVVPLLKRPHKLATPAFKVLLDGAKNGSITNVSIVEVAKGESKVATHAQW